MMTMYCDNESAVNTVSLCDFARGVKAHTAAEFDRAGTRPLRCYDRRNWSRLAQDQDGGQSLPNAQGYRCYIQGFD